MMRPFKQRSGRPRRGLTLVEILISIIMLTVGVMGLLGSTAAVAKQMGGGVRQTVAATVAQARIDSLTSLSCASLAMAGVAAGTSITRGVSEKWIVTDGKNIKSIAVEITIPRRTTKLLYTTVIPCRDGT
jgi:hypothetical protein